MNVLVIGCGAIGSFYAERLANADATVYVTARGAHLEALKRNGLTVIHDGETRHQAVTAYAHSELQTACQADDFDVIVIALKARAICQTGEETVAYHPGCRGVDHTQRRICTGKQSLHHRSEPSCVKRQTLRRKPRARGLSALTQEVIS